MADEWLSSLSNIDVGSDFPSNFDIGGGGFDWGSLAGGAGGQWDWLQQGMQNMGQSGPDWASYFKGAGPVLSGIGDLGKFGFGAWQAIDRSKQMADYNKAVQDYYKKQADYITQKQAWEKNFMDQFAGAQEEFGGAKEEFQAQIAEAQGHAQEVMGQFLEASKPLLAQSQALLVPGVAALARGETPAQWEPLLNEARLRGTTAMVQSMVSAGMSPEAARAAAQPVAEQQAQTLLLQLATNMIQQGGMLGQQGMAGLQGAGGLTQIEGQLAAMGMQPESQEFAAMMSVLGHILGGGSNLGPPPPPQA